MTRIERNWAAVSSLRKRYDAQVVVPCEMTMKMAVRKAAEEFGLSDADIARRCIEAGLTTVREHLTAERRARASRLTAEVDPSGELPAAAGL